MFNFKNQYPLLILFLKSILVCSPAMGAKPLDCSGSEYNRDRVVKQKEFHCESNTNCSVALQAPKKLEGYVFSGFNMIFNQVEPEVYDLAFRLAHEVNGDQVVGYIYGTKASLEKSVVSASYRGKSAGCSLRSSTELQFRDNGKS